MTISTIANFIGHTALVTVTTIASRRLADAQGEDYGKSAAEKKKISYALTGVATVASMVFASAGFFNPSLSTVFHTTLIACATTGVAQYAEGLLRGKFGGHEDSVLSGLALGATVASATGTPFALNLLARVAVLWAICVGGLHLRDKVLEMKSDFEMANR